MSIRSSPAGTTAAPQGDRLKTVLSAGLGRLSLHCTPCSSLRAGPAQADGSLPDALDARVFQYASDELRNDKEVVLAAVTVYGYLLRYASLAMRNDKEVVLAAVTQDGRALRFASVVLQNDPDVVRAAGR